MNEKIYRFRAVLKKVPDIDGAYIEFPGDARQEFGKGRVKVSARFDGIPYEEMCIRDRVCAARCRVSSQQDAVAAAGLP